MIRRVYVEDIILCYFGSLIMSGFELIGAVSKAIPDRRIQIKKKQGADGACHQTQYTRYQTILVPVSFNASLRKEFETTLLALFKNPKFI